MSTRMVKSKREISTPRRRVSLTKKTITKITARPASAVGAAPSANIKVVVRVRPPNEREQGDNSKVVVKVVDDQMLIFDPKEDAQPFFYQGVQQKHRDLLKKANKHLQFVFDKVFRDVSSNYEVFENSTQSLIDTLMDGYNCSVFAYGATGAGKTFTMIGTEETPGITFLTMTELFKKKDDLSVERDFELGISYLEVYNELVKDLLNPGPPLHLREDGKYGVMVSGIKVHKIVNPDELFLLLAQGNKNRTQHPTDANAESSRSHAVFQVYIQMTMKTTREVRTAKLSMIDLAGSERGSATNYAGARFTEGANINKSLLALGNCINSLADGHRHVPYRDSKLTRLLKDSLGGNCQTVMIANVSPSSLSFEDTYNTLKYAMRAKKIKSNMKRNVMNVEMHIGQYVKMVEDLRKENATLKRENEALRLEKEENKTDAKPPASPVTTEAIVVPKLDPILLEKIKKLYEQKQDIIERKYQIESTEIGMNLRRKLKEESDSRLSAICIGTPQKREAHRKINSAVDRFKMKESALRDELSDIENDMKSIEEDIGKLVEENEELGSVLEMEDKKLEVSEYENKHMLDTKKIELLLDDHREKCALLERMAGVLKPCFVTMKNHGFANSDLIRKYEDLVLDFQGRKNIRWGDVPDSGISSSTSLNDEETRATKRKIEENAASTDSLDNTFTVPSPRKPKVQLCAQQVMAKVYIKPSTPKKLNAKSPRNDNRVRKPLERIDTAKRIVANKSKINIKGNNATKPMAERPPFRR